MMPTPPYPDTAEQIEAISSEIKTREVLAHAIWRVLPAFFPQSAVERMGIDNLDTILLGVRGALRDCLCHPLEFHLTGIRKMAERMKDRPASPWSGGYKIEDLIKAQEQVSLIENAMEKIEGMPEDEPGSEMARSVMLPIYELQLSQARNFLSSIQEYLEPKPDEATSPAMSNETKPGEVETPEEAK